jgi:hypothetical protein
MKRINQEDEFIQPRLSRPHEVFAVMNSLRNPRLAAIYLSLVASSGTAEEIEQARRLIERASMTKD